MLDRLQRIESGVLKVADPNGLHSFGDPSADALVAEMVIKDPRFYRAVVTGGGLGAAESYIRRDWDTDDLLAVLQVFARNYQVVGAVESTASRFVRPLRAAANWLRRNSRAGSKRNIAAHYDLSNEFFALMLDPTMTYSSGVFTLPDASLEEASIEKYDRICRKLRLSPTDRVLEIGTGWGGFAEHAARHYGCHVTTTTISAQQHAYAQSRFAEGGLQDSIELLMQDYRDLSGRFSKIVSIEMIEAVGHQYLDEYFRTCSRLLDPDGEMMLQAITIPDHRYDRYRKSVDFIQRYIFPGGVLPSMGAICSSLAKATDFRFAHSEDFGSHYATTLNRWRQNFWEQMDSVRLLGFDDRFVRTWNYYLCYCEAGFRERQIGVSQIHLTKPGCRREPVLGV